MPSFGLLGASGATGRLVAAELARRGHQFIAAGRDPDKLARALHGNASVSSIRKVDVHDEDSLAALCRDVDVLLTTVGPFSELGRPVLAAAVEHGTHYVDSTGELPFVRWAFEEWGERAAERGAAVVPASGYDFVPGDLLAHLAADAVVEPSEVHVTYAVPSAIGFLRGVTKGTRASIPEVLGSDATALVDGQRRTERPGEERRLAWFPRPVGPQHAANFPGAEPLTVPRHVPGVATVRTYFAMAGWQAELFQFGASMFRHGATRELLTRLFTAGPGASRRAQEETRWACVAESHGANGVARAWANGTDIYGFTAATLVLVAESLADGPPTVGVVAPAEVLQADTALDVLADRVGLRWSVIRPE